MLVKYPARTPKMKYIPVKIHALFFIISSTSIYIPIIQKKSIKKENKILRFYYIILNDFVFFLYTL